METQSNEEKLEFWSLVVEEFENSGKSIREQCEANNIQLWQYYGWRKKVKNSATDDDGTFVEVEAPLKSISAEPSQSGVSLEYCSDFKIKLDEDFNPEVLGSLMKVLMSL